MTQRGIDYSFDRPGIPAIKAAGFGFVCRYLAYGNSAKIITKAEAGQIIDAGLGLILVWETTAQRALSGRAGGQADAREALRQANDLGLPSSRPIFFAVDFNATPGQQGPIDEYLRGAGDVIGPQRVGVYAGYWVVKRCLDNGSAHWAWQTYAWSGKNWDSRAVIRQVLNAQKLNGAAVDYDEAWAQDFGQWTGAVQPQPSWPITYTVKQTDSDGLAAAMKRIGISDWQEVARLNGLVSPYVIRVGQVLKLPPPPTPPPVLRQNRWYTPEEATQQYYAVLGRPPENEQVIQGRDEMTFYMGAAAEWRAKAERTTALINKLKNLSPQLKAIAEELDNA